MNIVSNEHNVQQFIAGSGGVTKGDLVVYSSGTVVGVAGGASVNTVVGIALETKAQGALVLVDRIGTESVIQAPFATGGTKKTFADTDLGLVYDVSNATTVNPDDTTGGICVVTGYDNLVKEVRFTIPATKLY